MLSKNFTCKRMSLPAIPDEYILSINEVKKIPQINDRENLNLPLESIVLDKTFDFNSYQGRTVDNKLNDYLKSVIKFKFGATYQIINNPLKKHIDNGNTLKFLYLIDTGGNNVVTEFYSADDHDLLIDSVVIPPRTWYLLNTGLPHAVFGDSIVNRFAIALTPYEQGINVTI